MRYDQFTVNDAQQWTELTNSFVPMGHRIQHADQWTSSLIVQQSTAYSLLRWDEPAGRTCYRTPGHVRRNPADSFYWFVVPQHSTYTVGRDDSVLHAPHGRAVLMGLDQVCRLRPGPSALALQLPRTEIDNAVPVDGPRCSMLDMDSGLGRVVATMIHSVRAERSNLSDREFNAVCDRISELLCMLALGDTSPQQGHLDETVEAVRRYVRDSIGVADLRLPAVAHALNWSPRQLRVALQQAGTTYRDVRREEALRAARDLLDSGGAGAMTITEIAARTGFTPTWFSAAFKARYGETPREFRQRRHAEARDAVPERSAHE
ncbi:AraC family transcriptional regulator [Nocardia mexicana]|uniref:AraC-like protein n=1 Tax=Nocardia mexicana TaxID=279262 RepID=A0A370HBY2_9NOCA|nr:AraC family transcriptional regulator [Nocardia mexicana]RDI54456.1 AraC-like protein [Nocardia mexicana]